MQKLEKITKEVRARPIHPTDEEIVNLIREYLQVRVLNLTFQSRFGACLSFMGGTCLRICYDLKRYSEDLDFALDGEKKGYQFERLMQILKRELELMGFEVSTNVHQEKTVQKAFLRFHDLFEKFRLQGAPGQKIHIKIEVDTHPILIQKEERETFFVTRFGEIFPILKHTLPTLFSGKILAVLARPYTRGRDYYDLVWYLGKKTPMNLRYLKAGLKTFSLKSEKDVYEMLQKKVATVKESQILKDMGRFLEDPKESSWISHYHDVFHQLLPYTQEQ